MSVFRRLSLHESLPSLVPALRKEEAGPDAALCAAERAADASCSREAVDVGAVPPLCPPHTSVLAAGAAMLALPMDPSAEWGSKPFAALQDVVNLKGFGQEGKNKGTAVSQTQH